MVLKIESHVVLTVMAKTLSEVEYQFSIKPVHYSLSILN